MFKLIRHALPHERPRAQVTVEFGLMLFLIVPFLLLLSVMLLSLYQASSVNQGAAWLGQRLTTTGTACTDSPTTTTCDWVAEFKDQMAHLGVVISSGDTIAISIISPDPNVPVRYFDQSQTDLVPTTTYGDTVIVRFVKPITGGLLAGSGLEGVIEAMPGSSNTWIGVAQLEKGPGSSGIPVMADFGLNYTDTVKDDAPIAYWRLSESGGTSFGEAGGNTSATGTIGQAVGRSAPSLITADTDSAFKLDGSPDAWLSVPDSAALDFGPGSAWSVEFWLSRSRSGAFTGDCSTSEEPLAVRGDSSIVLSRADGCNGDTGALDQVSVKFGSGLRLSGTTAISDASAHHVVVSYDGSHLGGSDGYVEVHIYIDGLDSPLRNDPFDTIPVSPNRFPAGTVAAWTGTLFWGADSSTGSERFAGTLDELAIYDQPLISNLVWLHQVAGVKSGKVMVAVGQTVYFQDLSNGMPLGWSWDFGDGSDPSTAQNPNHTYTTAGPKDVSLTVDTVAGEDAVTYVIDVSQGTPTITFTSTPPDPAVVGGSTYNVTAHTPSPVAIIFNIDAASTTVCSISGGNIVSFIAVGTCTIDANQASDANWLAAAQAQQSFGVGPATP